MQKITLQADQAAPSVGVYAQGVKVTNPGALLFVSGQVSMNEKGVVVGKGDPYAQMNKCLENMAAILEVGGATMDDVVMVKVYTTNMDYFKEIHRARIEYFRPEHLPASTLVEISRLIHPDLLVEIDAVAVAAK